MTFAVIAVEDWRIIAGIVGALFVLISGKVMEFWQTWLKNKRDRDNDAKTIRVLESIAASNNEIQKGQVAQNGKLASVVVVNEAHHAELIRTLQTTCRLNTNQTKT